MNNQSEINPPPQNNPPADNNPPANINQDEIPDFTMIAHPIVVTCPHCHKQGMTRVSSRISIIQWIICFLLCIF